MRSTSTPPPCRSSAWWKKSSTWFAGKPVEPIRRYRLRGVRSLTAPPRVRLTGRDLARRARDNHADALRPRLSALRRRQVVEELPPLALGKFRPMFLGPRVGVERRSQLVRHGQRFGRRQGIPAAAGLRRL